MHQVHYAAGKAAARTGLPEDDDGKAGGCTFVEGFFGQDQQHHRYQHQCEYRQMVSIELLHGVGTKYNGPSRKCRWGRAVVAFVCQLSRIVGFHFDQRINDTRNAAEEAQQQGNHPVAAFPVGGDTHRYKRNENSQHDINRFV